MRRERPIIFSGAMVVALLAGRKSQTRRKVRPAIAEAITFHDCEEARDAVVSFSEAGHSGSGWYVHCSEYPEEGSSFLGRCPYGVPGDRLWVKETWRAWERESDCVDHVLYQADGTKTRIPSTLAASEDVVGRFARWQPSLFMPRWASRITLEITNVRLQRLHEITGADALAEGLNAVSKDGGRTVKHGIPDRDGWPGTDDHGWPWQDWEVEPRKAFERLWTKINDAASWKVDPWVWAVSFRRIEQPARTESA